MLVGRGTAVVPLLQQQAIQNDTMTPQQDISDRPQEGIAPVSDEPKQEGRGVECGAGVGAKPGGGDAGRGVLHQILL